MFLSSIINHCCHRIILYFLVTIVVELREVSSINIYWEGGIRRWIITGRRDRQREREKTPP